MGKLLRQNIPISRNRRLASVSQPPVLEASMSNLFVFYTVETTEGLVTDGHTCSPPAVGDEIIYDKILYRVVKRTWQEAGTVLGEEAAKQHGVPHWRLACVTLLCEKVS